jgi:menaquinone-dependent protoporphyrinogen oxidase
MSGLLIVYGTKEGQTARIAETMARVAREHGVETDVLDGKRAPKDLNLGAYGGVTIAASVHLGRHERYIERFARAHASELNRMPSAFVSVSMSASRAELQPNAEKAVAGFVRRTGWTPHRQALIGGALLYRRYNLFLRWLMKFISRSEGLPTDTSRDYEFTDWAAVERFTEEFVALLTAPAAVAV